MSLFTEEYFERKYKKDKNKKICLQCGKSCSKNICYQCKKKEINRRKEGKQKYGNINKM